MIYPGSVSKKGLCPGPRVRKGLGVDLDLKLRLLSIIQAESVVLDLVDLTKS